MTEPSFDELFRAHRASVYRVARRVGVSAAEADEVSQEAFLVAYQKLDGYEERGAGRAWLARIATNIALRHVRGAQREARRIASLPPATSVDGVGVDEHLHLQSTARALRRCARDLPPAQWRAFELLALEGMSGPEAADALGISVNTVHSRARLAKEKLRRLAARRRLSL